MFLRRNRKKYKGVSYEYWTVVEPIRTAKGPRQRTVAALGKIAELDENIRVGWENIAGILDGKATQADFLQSPQETPHWATVDLEKVRIERLRHFGDVYLALALWRRLRLDTFFNEVMEVGREEIAWSMMACILTLARFCAQPSELKIADSWYHRTALDDLLGIGAEKINEARLYRALDELLPHKDGLFKHLQKMYGELFSSNFDLLLYDITSTYFEGECKGNAQAKRGYSRDSRPDCLQVCIALVVTPDGLPLSYEVFDGNRTDVTTVEEIVQKMREKYGHERRTWVMDRGMVSQANLDMLEKLGGSWLVGTPKSMLKKFEQDLLDESNWSKIEPDLEVKQCAAPEGSCETFVLCRSPLRKEKEKAMRSRQVERFEKAIERMQAQAQAPVRALCSLGMAERRLGRLQGQYPAAAKIFDVRIEECDDPRRTDRKRLSILVKRKSELETWATHTDGAYLLRTNIKGKSAQELWHLYIGLTQIEDSFRIAKHDLGLRPIYHHKEDRTKAHILVCFLSLVLWRTLQQWMQSSHMGTAPRKVLEELSELRSMDVVFPVGSPPCKDNAHATITRSEIRIRVVARPEPHLAILLEHLKLPLPNRPKRIQNVVEKIAADSAFLKEIRDF